MHEDDRAAIAAVNGGNPHAFRVLVERHSRYAQRVAYRLTGNASDAEDVVQDAFLKAFRQLGRFEARADFRTWIHKITVNCVAGDRARVLGGHDELWQLYQKEAAVPVRRQILQAMFVGGNGTRLIELAKTETRVDLRRTAVRSLGMMRASTTGPALVEIYTTQKDAETRRAAIQGLVVQDNAAALVGLARKETDPAMKRELVKRLSTMQHRVAVDYLLELLGK